MSKIDPKLAAKIKAAPAKLLKTVIVALSAFLTSLTPPKAAIGMGKSKEEASLNFLNAVNGVIKEGQAAELPGEVIDFYNKYFVGDDSEKKTETEKKKDTKPKEKPKKKLAERDTNGFIKDSNHSKLVTLLSKTPMKMGDVKKTMGNTYYSLVAKHEKIFAKDAAGNWYVIGSPASKLITSQKDADAAQAKVDAEKKTKKDEAKAKKDATAKEKKEKAAEVKAKKDAKAKEDAATAKKKTDQAASGAKASGSGGKKKKKKK